jgi:hypothetical protein
MHGNIDISDSGAAGLNRSSCLASKGTKVFSNVPISTEMPTNLNVVSVNYCCL